MALQTMIEKMNAAKKVYDESIEEARKDGASAIGELFKGHIPEGFAISWKQYTDYFNDGSPCVFRVRDPFVVKLKDGVWPRSEEGSKDYGADIPVSIHDAESYGTPPQEKSYQRTKDWRTKEVETITYTDPGVPALEGLTKEHLENLSKMWSNIPEKMLEAAFGDHVRCRIYSDGTTETRDHSDHD